jgi:hypothetical protein
MQKRWRENPGRFDRREGLRAQKTSQIDLREADILLDSNREFFTQIPSKDAAMG